MKIKQLMASGLAAVAAGATLAFGAFGAGLGDFVSVGSDSASLDSPVIVIGDAAKSTDVLGGIDIGLALGGYATKDVTIGGASGAVSATGTDDIMLSTDLNKTYIGSTKLFSDVKSSITETDLPVLLKTQSFTDKASTTINIAYLITPGRTQYVDWGRPSGVTSPVIYTQFGQSQKYNLTVNFLGGLDTAQVNTNYKIKLFNKEYTFGSTVSNSTLELYSSTGAQTLTIEGTEEEKTIKIEGVEHKIKLNGCDSTYDTAYISIDGAAIDEGWVQSSTYTFPGTTTKVYVKSVDGINRGGASGGNIVGKVTLFIGTDKLTITTSSGVGNVQKNEDTMTGVVSYISASGSKINSMTFEVSPPSDVYLMDGEKFTDPIFGSFSWALKGMNPAVDDASRDMVKIGKDGSTKLKLAFTNKAGTRYNVDVYSYASSRWKFSHDGSNDFWTTIKPLNQSVISQGDYFVLSTAGNKNSYIMQYTLGDTTANKRKAVFVDVGTNTKYNVYESDPYLRVGSDSFKVEGYSSNTFNVSVAMDGASSINNDTTVNTLYTKSGSPIILNGATTTEANITVGEFKLYSIGGSNEPNPATYLVSAAYASNDINLGFNSTSIMQSVNTTNEQLGISGYGSYVITNTDSDSVEIRLPGDRPAPANVAIGIDPVISTSGASSGGTFKEAVPVKNPVAKFASEVDAAMKTGKHLILIGGPCANPLTAEALNMSSEAGTCYTQFKAAYPATGVVKVVDGIFATGKKALVVAGLTGVNTRMLADSYVIKGTLEFAG